MQGYHTVGKLCQAIDISNRYRRIGAGLIRESIDGLWRRSGNLVFRWVDDFCASRSAVLFRPKRRELYRTRVQIHQKGLEPAMT